MIQDGDETIEEIDDINKYEEELEKQYNLEQEKIVNEFINSKEAKRVKVMKNLKEIDSLLKTALSFILNYYAEHGEFNQKLLEDVVPIIAKRHAFLRKIK